MVYNPVAVEIYRRITEGREASKRERLRKEEFQESCRKLAITLFGLLRDYDPWCVAIEFEGPLPLDPSSSQVSCILSASIQDITHGDLAPFIDYGKFEINIPEKNTWSVQRIKLSKRDELGATKWELETEVHIPEETFPREKIETDPATINRIQESIQRWSCKVTER